MINVDSGKVIVTKSTDCENVNLFIILDVKIKHKFLQHIVSVDIVI